MVWSLPIAAWLDDFCLADLVVGACGSSDLCTKAISPATWIYIDINWMNSSRDIKKLCYPGDGTIYYLDRLFRAQLGL